MKLPEIYANTVKKRPIDMTLSENPLGCSPRALRAAKNLTVKDIADYPDIRPLLGAAAKRFAVPPSCILTGSGSEQLIKLIAQTFLTKGDTALVQAGSFALFARECLMTGARVSLLDIQNPQTIKVTPKVIFICDPNNPTGEPLPEKTLELIRSRFPKTVIVIDEANAEFAKTTNIPCTMQRSNMLVLRTCSKALGLAGARIGFCIGNKKRIQTLKNMQQAFPVSTPSIVIATAAMQDRQFLNKTLNCIQKERNFVKNELEKKGFIVSDSVTNTLFVTSPDADVVIQKLDRLGVSVIPSSFFPGCKTKGFRIALRDKKTNLRFLSKIDIIRAKSLHHHHNHLR